jgi:hypothetical protein
MPRLPVISPTTNFIEVSPTAATTELVAAAFFS